MQPDVDVLVDFENRLLRTERLRASDVGASVNHLTLQVRHVDLVELDDPDGAHSCGREVEQCR